MGVKKEMTHKISLSLSDENKEWMRKKMLRPSKLINKLLDYCRKNPKFLEELE